MSIMQPWLFPHSNTISSPLASSFAPDPFRLGHSFSGSELATITSFCYRCENGSVDENGSKRIWRELPESINFELCGHMLHSKFLPKPNFQLTPIFLTLLGLLQRFLQPPIVLLLLPNVHFIRFDLYTLLMDDFRNNYIIITKASKTRNNKS
jgi:hypothetical protein